MSESEGGSDIKVAVVGCGLWGRNHVRNHAEIGSLAAVVDRDPAVAAEFASRFEVPARSFEEVLADPAIAACVLALPPSQNLPLGRRVLEAGKHLFVEKPLTLAIADAEALCAIAEAQDRRLMVGHILRFHAAFTALHDLVRSGRLGEVAHVVSNRLDLGRIRREEDALWALAPHDVSMVLALVGSEPERVAAFGGYHTHPTIADETSVHLAFSGGRTAEIRSSWLNPFKEHKLTVIGRDAMAVFDDREPWDTKLVLYPHRVGERDGKPFAERAEPEPVRLAQTEPLRQECLHFLDSIRTGRSPMTDGREGLRVLRVLRRASDALAADRRAA